MFGDRRGGRDEFGRAAQQLDEQRLELERDIAEDADDSERHQRPDDGPIGHGGGRDERVDAGEVREQPPT